MTSDLDPTSETSLEALDASASRPETASSDPEAAPILEEELR